MQHSYLIGLALVVSCADGTGPALSPCPRATTSSADLCGSWVETGMVPGASLVLDLRVHGDRITGTGAYSIEAGRAGTLQIDGAYSNPGVAITIVYDYGPSAVFSGTVSASQDITGTITFPPEQPVRVTFSPR